MSEFFYTDFFTYFVCGHVYSGLNMKNSALNEKNLDSVCLKFLLHTLKFLICM